MSKDLDDLLDKELNNEVENKNFMEMLNVSCKSDKKEESSSHNEDEPQPSAKNHEVNKKDESLYNKDATNQLDQAIIDYKDEFAKSTNDKSSEIPSQPLNFCDELEKQDLAHKKVLKDIEMADKKTVICSKCIII